MPSVLALLSLLASRADGAELVQPIQPGGLPGFTEVVSVPFVLVPVAVRSTSGTVPDLRREDFRLYVEGEPVAIESFEANPDAPASVLFLQDLSGSMEVGGRLAASRAVVDCILGRGRPDDRYAVATFTSGRIGFDVSFTGERERVGSAAAVWRGYGTTALYDAIAWLPDLLPHDRGTRAAVVLLTDGLDNASVTDAEAARETVRRAGIPVYAVSLTPEWPQAAGEGEGRLAGASDVLKLLTLATGGRFFAADSGAAGAACADILEDLRHQYVLGFSTRESGSVEFRELAVEVAGQRLALSHRLGYQGTPPRIAGPQAR